MNGLLCASLAGVILDELTVDDALFEARTGWAIKPQGACKGDICVPLPDSVRTVGLDRLDVRVLADRLGMPLVADDANRLWALGPETEGTGRVLTTAVAPDLELPDADGKPFRLTSLRGQKVVLASWASWCGCRFDLPVWQELRDRWKPHGVEVVTVALDIDPDDARPYIERAHPEHPSLIDCAHVTDELFGFVNVPNGVWIDEDGVIVRSAEPAHPGRNKFVEEFRTVDLDTIPPETVEIMKAARRIKADPEIYATMVDDWIANGAESEFVHTPEEVVARSDPRPMEHAQAAAEFELGQHLHRAGKHEAAIPHWRTAHRLFPENWTYKRQAWNLEDPMQQRRTDAYDSCWFEDLVAGGPENYYRQVIP